MKKYFSYILVAALVFAATFSSCEKEEEPTYTVSFNSKGGTPAPQAQTVKKGGKVSKPADPTRENFNFAGWAKADNETSAFWDFATETVAADMTLFARWTTITHAVTFDSDGGTAVTAQNVAHGSSATKPADPTRDGYVFNGWFDGDTEWDFTTPITAPVTLKAGWADPPKLDFSDNGIRDDISSYLRGSFQQWSNQASSADLENMNENYMEFLRSTGIENYLTNKLSENNELAAHLFDGVAAKYTKEENASICREILKVIDIYETSIFVGERFLRIKITCDYPLRIENVYNKVLGKYSSTNPSTIPADFNHTLLTALLEEVKSGLPLGTIYGCCQLEMEFNTITGEVFANFYNGGNGFEIHAWNTEPTSILIGWNDTPCDLWTGLWDAIKNELMETYTSQNMELQNWDIKYLDLHLSGYNPFKYKLVVYILVDGGWWIKPQWNRSFPVGFDLQYHIWTQTGANDDTATVAAAMILPIDSNIGLNGYTAAKAVAVDYKEIDR